MKYVFGPVPSRRLGQSLGIDTIPLKTCNWNCVYCQLGRTLPLTNLRKEYSPVEDILAETRDALEAHKPGEIDWITFVGSGEPLLHTGTGWLIRQVKRITPLPVAVITNGSLSAGGPAGINCCGRGAAKPGCWYCRIVPEDQPPTPGYLFR